MCPPNSKAKQTITKDSNENASFVARYTAASILLGILSIWWKYTFVPIEETPALHTPVHSYKTPLILTTLYLISLPVLKYLTPKNIDLKPILKESMIIYNVVQVLLNGWMVYKFLYAVMFLGHPFIGDVMTMDKGTTYAIWVHYCDKYLEFLDTYFMVLRGKLDQVSFLHVYHHTTIAWAWWAAMILFPGGDSYFGALFNSWIHVMMYSYYALSLLKIPCPWKKFLTMAQLFQFASVVVYTLFSMASYPVYQRTKWHYIACAIQIGEMVSLFVLFSQFYKKSYSSKKKNASKKAVTSPKLDTSSASSSTNAEASKTTPPTTADDADDQCQLAVAQITTETVKAASAAMKVASKESTKIIQTAKKVPHVVNKQTEAMSRPSWSIVN